MLVGLTGLFMAGLGNRYVSLIIIVVSLIVLSCLGVHWGSKYQMTPSEEMTVLATDSAANHSFQKTLWNVYNNFVDSGNLISISPERPPVGIDY